MPLTPVLVRPMPAVRAAIMLAGGGLLLYACDPQVATIDPRIERWMTCIECIDREQAEVVAMGQAAVPALRTLLIEGPPDTTIARKRAALSEPYYHNPSAPNVQPPTGYITARLDDFAARYRVRSSLALGLIGTDSARRVLCDARAMQFRPDVRRFIDSSLALLQGSCP